MKLNFYRNSSFKLPGAVVVFTASGLEAFRMGGLVKDRKLIKDCVHIQNYVNSDLLGADRLTVGGCPQATPASSLCMQFVLPQPL